jgi:hypothetical protein
MKAEMRKKKTLRVTSLSTKKRAKISTYGQPCYDSTVHDKHIHHKEQAKG